LANSGLTDVVYVEPFAGGAGAALALLLRDRVRSIVINDFDRAIYSFWKSAVTESERFIDRIHTTPITVPEWRKQKAIYQDRRSKRFDLGFATFFLNRTNRSGFLAGGPIGGMDQKGKWKLTARYNKAGLATRIEKLQTYRDRIKITNKDGVELLDNYLKNEHAFMYLDPPYYEKGATLYMNHYQRSDHELLAMKLNANASSRWILTYDNNPVIRTLYHKRRKHSFSLNYNAYEPRVGRELLIMSDAM
jgi:DNA adenine methylase